MRRLIVPEGTRSESPSGIAEPRSGPSPADDAALSVDQAIGSLIGRLLDDAPTDPRDPLPLRDVLQMMAVEGTQVVRDTECVISIVPVSRPDVFQIFAASGNWAEGLIGKEWPLHEGMLHGRAMLQQFPIETTDAPADSAAPEVFGSHIRLGRLVPMSTGAPLPDGRVSMGVVGFWRPEARPFTDADRAIMDRFTRLISIIVLGDDARESNQHLVERLRLTGEATRDLSSSLDPSRVVQAIIERIAELVDVDRITVTKFWPDSIEAIAGYDRTPRPRANRREMGPHAGAPRGDRQRRSDASKDSPISSECRPTCRNSCRTCAGGSSSRCEPADGLLGILAVSRRTDQPFGQLDLDNLEQIALSAALALQNASLFAETKEAQQKALHALLSVSDHLDATSSEADLYCALRGNGCGARGRAAGHALAAQHRPHASHARRPVRTASPTQEFARVARSALRPERHDPLATSW